MKEKIHNIFNLVKIRFKKYKMKETCSIKTKSQNRHLYTK